MHEEESPLFQKKRTLLQKIAKLIFVLSALFLVMITILANMGGSNDMLREAVENFVSERFGGRPAKVANLERMSFFPKIGVSAKGVQVLSKAEGGYPLVKIGKIQMFMSFWDVAMGNSEFTHFYLENAEAIKGMLFPNEFYIERAYIDNEIEQTTALLKANGKSGARDWFFQAQLEAKGKNGKYKYKPGKRVPFSGTLADVNISGALVKYDEEYFKIEDLILEAEGFALIGEATISSVGSGLLKLKFDLATKDKSSVINTEVIIALTSFPMKISGTVKAEQITLSDFSDSGAVKVLLQKIQNTLGYEAESTFAGWMASAFARYDVDIDFDFKAMSSQEETLSNITLPYVQKKGNTIFGPVLQSGKEVFPAFTTVISNEKLISFVQSGTINTKTASVFAPKIPQKIKSLETLEVECGVAEFAFNEKGLEILSFGMNLKNGSISAQEKQVSYDTELRDLSYLYSAQQSPLPEIELNQETYKFVQESKPQNMDGCATYIKEIPDTQAPSLSK